MINQWGTHADALGMLLGLRGTAEQFTVERAAGISRAAHGVVVSISKILAQWSSNQFKDFQKSSSEV